VNDLLTWTTPKKSGMALGGATVAWVLFGGLTGFSVAQIVALLITLAVPVLFIAQAAGPYLGKQALIQ
jgi:hypothetical protein